MPKNVNVIKSQLSKKMSYSCSYACGVCKIVCYMCCCKFCKKESLVKEEISLLALGLSGSGKSTMIARVCGENEEEIAPTKGFSMKDISLDTLILHVKEVGGSDSIRRYWHHYFNGTEGLIFVVDGTTSDDEIARAKTELNNVLTHQDMKDVPLLVLVNKIDLGDSSNLKILSEKLDIPNLCTSRSFVIDAYDLEDVTHLKTLLGKFVDIIKHSGNISKAEESPPGEPEGVKGRI